MSKQNENEWLDSKSWQFENEWKNRLLNYNYKIDLQKMNKYYTPEIEEFYIGFEYEMIQYLEPPKFDTITSNIMNNPKVKWHKHIIRNINQISEISNITYINNGEYKEWIGDAIRVKYLDQEDIESLGFKFLTTEKFGNTNSKIFIKYGQDCYFKLTLFGDNGEINIRSKYNNIDCGITNLTIKNKSELKKLLKQLNIE